jgi:hypothetical protein
LAYPLAFNVAPPKGGIAMKRILVRPGNRLNTVMRKILDNQKEARLLVTSAINRISSGGSHDFSENNIFTNLTEMYGDVLNSSVRLNIGIALNAIRKGSGAKTYSAGR